MRHARNVPTAMFAPLTVPDEAQKSEHKKDEHQPFRPRHVSPSEVTCVVEKRSGLMSWGVQSDTAWVALVRQPLTYTGRIPVPRRRARTWPPPECHGGDPHTHWEGLTLWPRTHQLGSQTLSTAHFSLEKPRAIRRHVFPARRYAG